MDNNAMTVQFVRILGYLLSSFLVTKGYIDPAASAELTQNIELLTGGLLGVGTFVWWLKANWRKS
ncbi:hypothetical protein [Mesorhizobium sp. CN2-181]|uniref:Pam3-gp28 family putative phage holin n=1 Tax=Mesorhizobium yinganensis TaxID=3157707 RepID=UPI0032B70078